MNYTFNQPLGYSHIGLKDNQEDNVFPKFETVDKEQHFFILCDGVGGQDHGEVASQTVCETVGTYLVKVYQATGSFTEEDIHKSIEKAYDALDAIDDESSERKMATTFTCVCFGKDGVLVAHMGDSRIYQIRPGKGLLYQSSDHSLVNALLMAGEISKEEVKEFPRKNVIIKAVQPHGEKRFNAEVHLLTDVQSGDYFFLCSDGVLERLTNERLVEILSMKVSDDIKKTLLETESIDKTKDNFTAYIVPVKKVKGFSKSKGDYIKDVAIESQLCFQTKNKRYLVFKNKKGIAISYILLIMLGWIIIYSNFSRIIQMCRQLLIFLLGLF